MSSKTARAASALKSGAITGTNAILSTLNSFTPHVPGAVDIMVVEQPNGSLKSSPFYVRFGKYTPMRVRDKVVRIFVNGEEASFSMHLGSTSQAYFAATTEELVSDQEEDEQILSGMMSPPSGYSSEAEDGGAPYATEAIVSAVQEEVARQKEHAAAAATTPTVGAATNTAGAQQQQQQADDVQGMIAGASSQADSVLEAEAAPMAEAEAAAAPREGGADGALLAADKGGTAVAAVPAATAAAAAAADLPDVALHIRTSHQQPKPAAAAAEDSLVAEVDTAGADADDESSSSLGDTPTVAELEAAVKTGLGLSDSPSPFSSRGRLSASVAAESYADGAGGGLPLTAASLAAAEAAAAAGAEAGGAAAAAGAKGNAEEGPSRQQQAPSQLQKMLLDSEYSFVSPDKDPKRHSMLMQVMQPPAGLQAQQAQQPALSQQKGEEQGDDTDGQQSLPQEQQQTAGLAAAAAPVQQLEQQQRVVVGGADSQDMPPQQQVGFQPVAAAATGSSSSTTTPSGQVKPPGSALSAGLRSAVQQHKSKQQQEQPAGRVPSDGHAAAAERKPVSQAAAAGTSTPPALATAQSSLAAGSAPAADAGGSSGATDGDVRAAAASSTTAPATATLLGLSSFTTSTTAAAHAAAEGRLVPMPCTPAAAASSNSTAAPPASPPIPLPPAGTAAGPPSLPPRSQAVPVPSTPSTPASQLPPTPATSLAAAAAARSPAGAGGLRASEEDVAVLGTSPAVLGTSPLFERMDSSGGLGRAAAGTSPGLGLAPELQLSTCMDLLQADMDPAQALAAFESQRLTAGGWAEQGVQLLQQGAGEGLVVRLWDTLYSWQQAAPLLLGLLAFGSKPDQAGPLAPHAVLPLRLPPSKSFSMEKKAAPPGSTWRLWPFSGWRETSGAGSVRGSTPPATSVPRSGSTAAAAAAVGEGMTARSSSAPAAAGPGLEASADSASSAMSPLAVGGEVPASLAPSSSLHRVGSRSSMTQSSPRRKPRPKHIIIIRKTLMPTDDQLRSLPLRPGRNTITFRASGPGAELTAYVYCMHWSTRLVISDVDGTITRSDLLGHVLPTLGVDWSHPGITQLFHNIARNGYQIMFLSSRAISQANITREYLHTLVQGGFRMPLGPVIISPHGLLPSLYREIVVRRPHEFKIACLQDIRGLFPPDWNPFYAGFGNRDTDVVSYREVGVPLSRTFIINPKGQLVKASTTVQSSTWSSLSAINELVEEVFPYMEPGAPTCAASSSKAAAEGAAEHLQEAESSRRDPDWAVLVGTGTVLFETSQQQQPSSSSRPAAAAGSSSDARAGKPGSSKGAEGSSRVAISAVARGGAAADSAASATSTDAGSAPSPGAASPPGPSSLTLSAPAAAGGGGGGSSGVGGASPRLQATTPAVGPAREEFNDVQFWRAAPLAFNIDEELQQAGRRRVSSSGAPSMLSAMSSFNGSSANSSRRTSGAGDYMSSFGFHTTSL